MKVRRSIHAILLMAALAANSLASDLAELNFIGFSDDGKYLAFEEFGGDSESDLYDYDEIYYVETAKNSFAAAPSILQFDDTISAKSKPLLRARHKREMAGKLKRFGIVRRNTGQLVVAHLLSDWSFVKPVESERYFTGLDGTPTNKLMPSYAGAFVPETGGRSEKIIFNPHPNDFVPDTSEFYELTLDVKTFKNADGFDAYKISLTLQDNTQHKDIALQILQEDAENLPKRRQNATGYKIEQVYLYGNKIAVFLNVFDPGFEGPAMRYMVVTGKFGE